MAICNHHDLEYRKQCFDAYNRWMAEYCAAFPPAPRRRATPMRSPAEGISDIEAIKARVAA
jgi:hypothetical protein